MVFVFLRFIDYYLDSKILDSILSIVNYISEDRNQKRRNTRSPSPDDIDAPSNKKAKRGLMGFSIDDILSHKTAAVMKEHEQMMKFQQVT